MGRAPAFAFLAVLCVAAVPVIGYLTEPRETTVSTPSAFTGLYAPLNVPPGSEACADEILFDDEPALARFAATAVPGTTAPALEVLARGNREGEYRDPYRSSVRLAGGWTGVREFSVAFATPSREAFGTFCVRNRGDETVALAATEPGRAIARPQVTVDGEETPLELSLRFVQPERASVLSRAGEITERAATLRPFGAWWWWALAIALLTLAPAGLLLALRAALDAPGGVRAERPSLMTTWPALRERLRALDGRTILVVVAALAAAWFSYWAYYTHVFQADEDQYVFLSRWLQQEFPGSLFAFDDYGRGLQRLEVWLLAIPSAAFDAPWSLRGGRLLNILAFVSTSIPVYLLGRGVGLRSAWAALPAALSILVPWAVVTTAFLTENVAYPACFWALWAIWRTAARPSAVNDVGALVLLVVAANARTALLLLIPVLPLVVAATGLRCRAGSIATRVRAVVREHPVLWAAVALSAGWLALGPLGVDPAEGFARRLAGGYTSGTDIQLFDLLRRAGGYVSKTVVGTGFLPAAVALPWLVLQVVRSRDPERFAFAFLLLLTAVALLYSLNGAGPDERYIIYLAPLVLLPATVAVAGREVRPLGLAAGSVLLALLLIRVPWNGDQGPFGFFVSPVEMFYARAVGLRLATYIPGDADDALLLVGIALGAGGVALAFVLHRAPRALVGWPTAVLVAGVAFVMLVETNYALSKYVNGAGSRAAADLDARSFVDRLVPDDASVGVFAEGIGLRPEFAALWQEVQFYNERIDRVYTLGAGTIPVPYGDRMIRGVRFDPRTGRLASQPPLPDYVVASTQVGRVRLRGERVARAEHASLELIRIEQPAALEWSARGFDPAGDLSGEQARVRFFAGPQADGEQCGAFALLAPPDRAVAWTLSRDREKAADGELKAGGSLIELLPLPDLAERHFVDVTLRGGDVRVAGVELRQEC